MIFLYAIFDRSYERATTDVDFLARRISNSSEEIKRIFMEILAENTDDALVFDLNSVEVEDISEFKEYHSEADHDDNHKNASSHSGKVIFLSAVPAFCDENLYPYLILSFFKSSLRDLDLFRPALISIGIMPSCPSIRNSISIVPVSLL